MDPPPPSVQTSHTSGARSKERSKEDDEQQRQSIQPGGKIAPHRCSGTRFPAGSQRSAQQKRDAENASQTHPHPASRAMPPSSSTTPTRYAKNTRCGKTSPDKTWRIENDSAIGKWNRADTFETQRGQSPALQLCILRTTEKIRLQRRARQPSWGTKRKSFPAVQGARYAFSPPARHWKHIPRATPVHGSGRRHATPADSEWKESPAACRCHPPPADGGSAAPT